MTIGAKRLSQEDLTFSFALCEIAVQHGGTFVGSGSDVHSALAKHVKGKPLTTCSMHADHLLRDLAGDRGRDAPIAVERSGIGREARWSITPAFRAVKHPFSSETLLITPDERHAFRRISDGALVRAC